MNRVDFINRTCMDDELRQSILEVFWDQFMLVCELSDSVEEVIPIPIAIDTGKIAFKLVYSDAGCVSRMKQMIDDCSYTIAIYERRFSINYQIDTHPNVITVMIE